MHLRGEVKAHLRHGRGIAWFGRDINGIRRMVNRVETVPHMRRRARHGAQGKESRSMITPQRRIDQRSRWRAAFAGSLLSALLLMAPNARAAEPTPVGPAAPPSAASTRKAYVGLFKDNAVAVL